MFCWEYNERTLLVTSRTFGRGSSQHTPLQSFAPTSAAPRVSTPHLELQLFSCKHQQYLTADSTRAGFTPQKIIGWSSTSRVDYSKAVRSARSLEHWRPTTHDQALSSKALLTFRSLDFSGIVCIKIRQNLEAFLEQNEARILRPTPRHGFLGGGGLFEPWEFGKQFEYAGFGAIYCGFEKC